MIGRGRLKRSSPSLAPRCGPAAPAVLVTAEPLPPPVPALPIVSVRRPNPPIMVRSKIAGQWHAFEARLADGVITDAVIRLANGEQVTVRPGTPVVLGPQDSILWRERHGWGWSMGTPVAAGF